MGNHREANFATGCSCDAVDLSSSKERIYLNLQLENCSSPSRNFNLPSASKHAVSISVTPHTA